jgi:hypothetical protein
MKIKINNISVLINFIPSLWKMYFFHFYKKGITGRTFLNVFLLGFQIRIIKYEKPKEISIEEIKEILKDK